MTHKEYERLQEEQDQYHDPDVVLVSLSGDILNRTKMEFIPPNNEDKANMLYEECVAYLEEFVKPENIHIAAKKMALYSIQRILMANPHTSPVWGDVRPDAAMWIEVREVLKNKY